MRKTVIILLWVVIGGGVLLSIGGACVVILIGIGIGRGESHLNPPEFVFRTDPVPRWSPDGSTIVFGHGDGRIYVASSDGTHLHSISVTLGKYDVDVSPSVSPDGSRIAYATLRHETGFPWSRSREFEIVSSALDGSDKRRLTENRVRDRYPVWSPSGEIAFTSSSEISSPATRFVATVSSDGDSMRQVVSLGGTTPGAIISPPVWSPDGARIAFVAISGDQNNSRYAVYVAEIDGSDLTLIRQTSRKLSKPSWSPDGRRIAFAELYGVGIISEVYIADHDGSNLRTLLYLGIPGKVDTDSDQSTPSWYISFDRVSWPPDGSEILVDSSIISLEAPSGLVLPGPGGAASWSPDGSRVAINAQGSTEVEIPGHVGADYDDIIFSPRTEAGVVLYTVNSDGSDARVLVKQGYGGTLLPANARPLDYEQPATTIYFDDSGRQISAPYDIAQCSNGVVVPNPYGNPGLVRDCETLLRIRESLGADRPLNWSTDTPISEWEGIQRFNASGVLSILLSGRYLSGEISAEFGKLSALDDLNLNDNRLHGEIPSELADLRNLLRLYLGSNELEGEIPAELGNLTNLRELLLSNNELEGEIPAELGNLTNLRGLYLSNNELEGEIPAELGNLTNLRELSFDHDQLTGMLELLSMLDLGRLWLEGSRCIPERVFEMVGFVYHDDHVGPCED